MSNINEIESQLWAMANKLRGAMDASEYKNYILAFMFYKYLSERQEKYLLSTGLIEPEEGETPNDAYVKAVESDEELNDFLEDISSTLGYAIAPYDTWASLLKRVREGEVIPSDFQRIFDNFNKYAELNHEAAQDFKGIFNDVNLGDSRLGNNTNERAKTISGIVTLVDDVDYVDDTGKDILGDIYTYLIGQFAASAGKKGGEFFTPHEVSEVMAQIVTDGRKESDEVFSVYDPTCGSGSLLLTVGNALPGGDKPGAVKYFGQERNTTTYNMARMNLMMHDVDYKNMTLSNADSLERDWPDGPDSHGIDHPRSFDAVVSNPPYSQHWDNSDSKLKDARFSAYGKLAPKTKADYAFLLHGLYHLDEEGTMAIVLPHGVLFRSAAEEQIRKVLINKNYIDTIIGLPANLFYGTSIPTIIMVLKRNKNNKDILFIDASQEFEKAKAKNTLSQENIDKIVNAYKDRKDIDRYSHVASKDEVIQNDYNLNIPRYVDTSEKEPEIDLKAVLSKISETEKEISTLEKDIFEQLKILGVID
mgnify:FL=1